jgi:adenylate kinase family enzyme/transposase-like protein
MGSAAPSALKPVAGQDYPRNFTEFIEWFHSEADAWSYIARLRWSDGFSCPACGHGDAWLTDRYLYVCTNCRKQTSITAGTVFEGSRLSLRQWLYAIWLVAGEKRGVSAKSIQSALGLGSYRTAWLALQKIRLAMTKTSPDLLSGVVEVDESYIGGVSPGKRGRGTDKAILAIAVERLGYGKKSKRVKLGRVRMRVIPNTQRRTLEEFVTDVVAPGSIIHTDAKKEYDQLDRHGYTHVVTNQKDSPDPGAREYARRPSRRLTRQALGAGDASGWTRPAAPRRLPRRVHVPVQPARQPQPRSRLLPPAGAVLAHATSERPDDRALASTRSRQSAWANAETPAATAAQREDRAVMRKVAVIASASGNGKTTLGMELARRLDVPFVELDALVHGPGWVETPDDELRAKLEPIVASDGWVIDGTYQRKLGDLVLREADAVLWLDLPIRVWLPRLIRRTLRRIRGREQLWNDNRESLLTAIWGRESLFVWAFRSHFRRRRNWPTALASYPIVRLRTHADVEDFLVRASASEPSSSFNR